jgi:hypothetical protein
VDARQRRNARRAFIRAHHPDRGGDPAEFMAGLAALDKPASVPPAAPPPPAQPPVVVFTDPPWPRSFVTTLLLRVRRGWRRRVR